MSIGFNKDVQPNSLKLLCAAGTTQTVQTVSTGVVSVVQTSGCQSMTIYNDTGGTIYRGIAATVSTTGTNKGIPLTNGSKIEFDCTEGYKTYFAGAVAAGTIIVIKE